MTDFAIDLQAGRTIVLHQAVRVYTFKLRRATEQDWFAYFDAVKTTAEQRGREVVRTIDAGGAAIDLVNSLLISAEGYRLPANETSIQFLSDWVEHIPLHHRMAIADTILNVRAVDAEEDEEPVFGEGETITLEAIWSADADGNMRRVSNLKHTFKTPTAEHYRAYMNKISQSKVIGGSRSGRTVYTGAQRVLCHIYDELIQHVSGYMIAGDIATQMDARHKVAAAERLFAAAEQEIVD